MSITEGQIRDAALRALVIAPGGFLTTQDLILVLEKDFKPTGTDAKILDNRSDTHFSQKVRNLVSHRDQNTSLEVRGLATYSPTREGWEISTAGRNHVAALTHQP